MAKQFRVGVFTHPRKKAPLVTAYTRYFNERWEGCCLHIVTADNGTQAKAIAIGAHRDICLLVTEATRHE